MGLNGSDQGDLSLAKSLLELQRFVKAASNQTLGDLQLNSLNRAANANTDFQQAADQLIQHCLKIIRIANDWAQLEAESRYVNFLRESTLLEREPQAIEVQQEKAVKKRRKLLSNT